MKTLRIPASNSQYRMWFLDKMLTEKYAYHIHAIYKIEGNFDISKCKDVISELVKNNDSLRTNFRFDMEQLWQIVHGETNFEIEALPFKNDEQILAYIKTPFYLENEILFRCGIFKENNNCYRLVFVFHHSIFDGVSLNLFVEQFADLYNNKSVARNKYQFKHFVAWQMKKVISNEESKNFWKSYLDDISAPSEFIPKVENNVERNFVGIKDIYPIDPEIIENIKQFCLTQQISESVFYQSIFMLTLRHYLQENELVIGIPVAGRTRDDFRNIMGLFVNTLPFRIKLEDEDTFLSFVQRNQSEFLTLMEFSDYPFDQIVDLLELEKTTTKNPVFDYLFAYQNFEQTDIALKNCIVSLVPIYLPISRFNLSLYVLPKENKLVFEIPVNKYEKQLITDIKKTYLNLLSIAINQYQNKVSATNILVPDQLQLFSNLEDNNIKVSSNLLSEFNTIVNNYGNNVAVVSNGKSYTYAEIDRLSDNVAFSNRHLIEETEPKVLLLCERSIDFIIGLLAAIKLGGLYIPLDEKFPIERIQMIVDEASPKLCLYSNSFESKAKLLIGVNIQKISIKHSDVSIKYPQRNPRSAAYIIFTSGSTGKPKGSIIEDRGIIRLARHVESYPMTSKNRLISTTSLSFDAATFDIWGTFLIGAQLHLEPIETILEPQTFQKYCKEHEINIGVFSTGFFNQLVDFEKKYSLGIFKTFHSVLTGGEKISDSHISYANDNFSDTTFYNVYGPTENTTFSLIQRINKEDQSFPLGKVFRGTKVRVVDKFFNRVAAGVEGELLVGGEGVSRGYLNLPELTKEKFIILDNEIFYCTGDLVYWKYDGNLEFIGRKDNQIKVRGFRIEIEEIKNRLRAFTNISDAFVDIVIHNFSKYIVAWIVSPYKINNNNILEFLRQTLPEYMLPSIFIVCEKFPLNKNGKVDRKKLPLPEFEGTEQSEQLESLMMQELASIFHEVLQTSGNYSPRTNFFHIGGNSLSAVRLIAKIQEKFQKNISISELFQNPTIEFIENLLMKKTKTLNFEIEKVPERDYYPLMSNQKRLWILNKIEPENTSYNIPLACKTNRLDLPKVRESLNWMIETYDALRTSFHELNEEPIQKIHSIEEINIPIDEINFSSESDMNKWMKEELQKRMDLTNPCLMKFFLLNYGESEQIVYIIIHHIIADGWSISIFAKQFFNYYYGKQLKISTTALSMKDIAFAEPNILSQSYDEANFWSDYFQTIPVLNFRTNFPRKPIRTYEGEWLRFQISTSLTNNIRVFLQEKNITLYQFFFGVVGMYFSISGQNEEIVIGTPVAGRFHKDLFEQIGFFVNTIATKFSYNNTFREDYEKLFESVKKETLKTLNNQFFPFEKIIELVKPARNTGRSPLFDIMLQVQNNEEINDSITPYPTPIMTSKYDFSFHIFEHRNHIDFAIEYSTELYLKERVELIATQMQKIVEDIVSTKSPIQFIPKLPDERLNYIDFSDKISNSCKKFASNTAVKFNDQSMTFDELHNEILSISGNLQSLGLLPGDFVGVYCTRNIHLQSIILGIMTAGYVFVGLDPKYPLERNKYIVQDSEIKIVITNLEDNFSTAVKTIQTSQLLAKSSYSKNILTKNAPAYLIYTSGTTGNPKGVVQTRNNLSAFLTWCEDEFREDTFQDVLAVTSYCFDISIFELVYPILKGACTHIFTSAMELFSAEIPQNGVLLNTVPSVVEALIQSDFDFRTIKSLNMAGEAIPSFIIEKLIEEPMKIRNLYGPSEDTVFSTCYTFDQDTKIKIGKPIPGTTIEIFSAEGEILPKGADGELWISGDGIGLGYYNKVKENEEKYVSYLEKKWYRTGDLGFWDVTDNLCLLGRNDSQIKKDGYRIELGEIENQLLKIDSLNKVIVLFEKNQLTAFYTSQTSLAEEDLRIHLQSYIPSYMIPQQFVKLDTLTYLPNGKIDNNALRLLIPTLKKKSQSLINNELDHQLIDIWEKILGHSNFDKNSNFFDIGGTSLLLIKLHKHINKLYPAKLQIVDLFNLSTIAKQSEYLSDNFTKLKGIILDKDYVSTSSNGERSFSFEIPEKFLFEQSISFIASYLYAFYHLLDKSVTAYFVENGKMKEIFIDFESIESFDKVIPSLHKQMNNVKHIRKPKKNLKAEDIVLSFSDTEIDQDYGDLHFNVATKSWRVHNKIEDSFVENLWETILSIMDAI